MVEGSVNAALRAVISLSVQGPRGRNRTIEAVVDTGFNQFLILPWSVVSELQLPFVGSSQAFLGDGSEVWFATYRATLLWDDALWHVDAYAADAVPLAGMRLLRGHSLHVDVLEGGRVAIDAFT